MFGWRRKHADQTRDAADRAAILVVDDEPHIARLIEVNLQRAGYEVTVAHDGEAALGEVRARHPDGIVLDAAMPGLSGWEVFARLQEDPETRHVPVLMTGASWSGDWPPGLAGYLAKPFTPRELREFLRRVLNTTASRGPRSR